MTPLDIIATPGEDRSHCVVAFTGYQGELMLERHEFFRATEATDYSRVLVRDPTQTWYQRVGGGPWEIAEQVRDQVQALAPQTITVVGASAGGFAALLFGAELGAQGVHVFGAQTTIVPMWMDIHDRRFHHTPLQQVWEARLPSTVASLRLDVLPTIRTAQRLGSPTRYHLHLCGTKGPDYTHAKRLARLPHVEIHSYPCAGHGVARFMRDEGLLAGLLEPEEA